MLLNGGYARIWYKAVPEENKDRLRHFRGVFVLLRSLDIAFMHTFQKNNIPPILDADLQYLIIIIIIIIIINVIYKTENFQSISCPLHDYNRSHSIHHVGVFRHGQLVPYNKYSLLHL
jgi:hypothetical protein